MNKAKFTKLDSIAVSEANKVFTDSIAEALSKTNESTLIGFFHSRHKNICCKKKS